MKCEKDIRKCSKSHHQRWDNEWVVTYRSSSILSAVMPSSVNDDSILILFCQNTQIKFR